MNLSPISNFIFISLLQVLIFQFPVPRALPCSPLPVFVVFSSIRHLVDLSVIFLKATCTQCHPFRSPRRSSVLDIGQFHSPQMKPCKSPDYFIRIVVDMRQGESNIFQISTWKAFFITVTKNMFIMKNPTDFGKRVETDLGPYLSQLSPW